MNSSETLFHILDPVYCAVNTLESKHDYVNKVSYIYQTQDFTDMIIYNRVYLHLEKCYVLSRALVKVKLRLDAWSMHRKGPILNFDLDLLNLP